MKSFELLNGDCLQLLKWIESDSIDAIVTDPPYGLAFMGKKWDYDVPSVEIWTECLRVLKPGGHLLSFGGTRTYHRMVVNIEDAGFEIRDQIQWLYSSGFPKSTNVALRIDKESGAQGNRGKGFNTAGKNIGLNQNKELRSDHPDYIKPGYKTELAKQWEGWGTALKPANEPICLARKPLEKGLTVAQNVLKWGCGALNIDASRIAMAEGDTASSLTPCRIRQDSSNKKDAIFGTKNDSYKNNTRGASLGRWPANIILDEAAAEMLDAQSGDKIRIADPMKKLSNFNFDVGGKNVGQKFTPYTCTYGGASRFFYVAKASKAERNKGLEGMPKVTARSGMGGAMPIDDDGNARDSFTVTSQNHHPTVKPIKLMEYLIKLITPPNGIVLDPFMGSGSTGVASQNLKLEFLGIERERQYFEIANKRINKKEINK